MTWLRLDDDFYDHEKVADLEPAAGWLWVRALAWSAKHLRDGAVPAHVVVMLARTIEEATRLAGLLVTAGLWEVTAGGWRAHDFTEYNPSAEQVRAKRAAAKERMSGKRAHGKSVRANIGPCSPEPAEIVRANDARTDGERAREPAEHGPANAAGAVSACSLPPSRPVPSRTQSVCITGDAPAGAPEPVRCGTEERVTALPALAADEVAHEFATRGGKALNVAADSRTLADLGRLVRDLGTRALRPVTTLAAYQVLGDWIGAGGLGWWSQGRPSLAYLLKPGTLAQHLDDAATWDAAGRPKITHERGAARPAIPPRSQGIQPVADRAAWGEATRTGKAVFRDPLRDPAPAPQPGAPK